MVLLWFVLCAPFSISILACVFLHSLYDVVAFGPFHKHTYRYLYIRTILTVGFNSSLKHSKITTHFHIFRRTNTYSLLAQFKQTTKFPRKNQAKHTEKRNQQQTHTTNIHAKKKKTKKNGTSNS